MEQAAELSAWLVLRAGMEHQLLPSGAADVPCIGLLAVVVDIAGTAAALVGHLAFAAACSQVQSIHEPCCTYEGFVLVLSSHLQL
jgi:hypothetical protein